MLQLSAMRMEPEPRHGGTPQEVRVTRSLPMRRDVQPRAPQRWSSRINPMGPPIMPTESMPWPCPRCARLLTLALRRISASHRFCSRQASTHSRQCCASAFDISTSFRQAQGQNAVSMSGCLRQLAIKREEALQSLCVCWPAKCLESVSATQEHLA